MFGTVSEQASCEIVLWMKELAVATFYTAICKARNICF